jgi:hypothetical protein
MDYAKLISDLSNKRHPSRFPCALYSSEICKFLRHSKLHGNPMYFTDQSHETASGSGLIGSPLA